MSKTESGRVGEEIATAFLREKGYKILEKNFRTKIGEIDLIALKDDYLALVEVKARWSRSFGIPEEAISKRKLHTIGMVGEIYRSSHTKLPPATRIDVVAIEIGSDGQPSRLELIENASG